tara:strand:- start:858 stop:1037 length:180 start_codon:yes stop_codon:yes gene_type:complete
MEEKMLITREELKDLMNEIESIKSTIEILQDKEMIESIQESEEAKRNEIKPWILKSSKN